VNRSNNNDLKRLERSVEVAALEASEERFRLLVEGVKDYAIYMLDPQGHIVSWNSGAKRMKGYRAEEIKGKHFSVFYTEEDVERSHPEEELRVAAAEGAYEEEGIRVRKDGSRYWADVLITALRDEEGKLRGFAKVVRDITERKQAEERLEHMREAERSRIARDLHDGVLQDLAVAVQGLEAARIMQPRSGDLQSYFDPQQEIDTIRRAVLGIREAIYGLRPQKEEPFVRAVETLVERNRQLTPEREITLTVQDGFPAELPERMGVELLRIVQEALTNARRHSAALNVQVVLGVEEGDNLVVEVADDGRGFDPEAPKGGAGIEGMKERASLIGGDGEIRSEVGKGASVRVKVPLS
jgi:PAS domain S-box-containing protein